MRHHVSKRVGTTALLVIAGLFGTLLLAPAAPAATIRACQKKKGGAIRIVSSKTKCKKSEKKISWTTAGKNGTNGTNGAPGAAGAPGAKGDTGATGPAGSAVGYARVDKNGVIVTASPGILGVSLTNTGRYCFKLAFTPKVVVASAEKVNFENDNVVAMPFFPPGDLSGICAVGFRDASVMTFIASTGALSNTAFDVTFE